MAGIRTPVLQIAKCQLCYAYWVNELQTFCILRRELDVHALSTSNKKHGLVRRMELLTHAPQLTVPNPLMDATTAWKHGNRGSVLPNAHG